MQGRPGGRPASQAADGRACRGLVAGLARQLRDHVGGVGVVGDERLERGSGFLGPQVEGLGPAEHALHEGVAWDPVRRRLREHQCPLWLRIDHDVKPRRLSHLIHRPITRLGDGGKATRQLLADVLRCAAHPASHQEIVQKHAGLRRAFRIGRDGRPRLLDRDVETAPGGLVPRRFEQQPGRRGQPQPRLVRQFERVGEEPGGLVRQPLLVELRGHLPRRVDREWKHFE